MDFMEKIKEMTKNNARLVTISFFNNTLYYHFSLNNKQITINKSAKNAESICKLFPGAELYEREIMEKFEVKFKNHPNPVKLFT